MRNIILAVIVSAMLVVIGCSGKQKQTQDNHADHTAVAGVTDMERITLEHFRDCLADLAAKSPLADSLLRFYDANRVYARDMGDGTFMVLAEPQTQEFFYVYVGSGGDLSVAPGQAVIAATFNADVRAVELRSSSFSPLILGLLLAHELTHVQDFVTGREGLSEIFSPEWLAGEEHGHYTTYRILQEYTGGRWKQLALDSREERLRLVAAEGYQPGVFTLSPVPGDSARVASILTDATFSDLSVLSTWLTYDANILNIQELAGNDDQSRIQGVMMFTDYFYRKFTPVLDDLP